MIPPPFGNFPKNYQFLKIHRFLKIQASLTGSHVKEKQDFCAHRKNNFDSKWDLYVARKDALL